MKQVVKLLGGSSQQKILPDVQNCSKWDQITSANRYCMYDLGLFLPFPGIYPGFQVSKCGSKLIGTVASVDESNGDSLVKLTAWQYCQAVAV